METKSGCLLINKPVGLTSRQVGVKVMKAFGTKKVGHLGTLDPFAEGLLIVMVNNGTRIGQFMEEKAKTYRATLKLGVKTDTGDLTGKETETKEVPVLSKDKIAETLNKFLGKGKQIPPMYSSIRVNGEHLYHIARNGNTVEREPRDIEVYSIELNDWNDGEIVFTAKVSKGTYIRTLGEDIAEALGTVGHLTRLVRTEIDGFSLNDAINIEDIAEDKIVSIADMLSFLPKFRVYGPMEKLAINGVNLFLRYHDRYMLIYNDEGPIAVYEFESEGVYHCCRGLR